MKPEYLKKLSQDCKTSILKRAMLDVSSAYLETRDIVFDVRDRGDVVTLEHYRKFKEDINKDDLVVTQGEIDQAYQAVDGDVIEKLKFAAKNIEKFHKAQLEREMWAIEIMDGIMAGRLVRSMDVVGAYVPGRKAFYPSSVLMTIIPAKVAGVGKIIACTPPNEGMVTSVATLVAADVAGADQIFKIGGPWAVASMAYGTESVPKVDKIVGPGNKYVTAAKMTVFGEVDIDSPAGPSEVLILADETADARMTAIDMLSQLEHDEDAAAVLVITDEELANQVCEIITEELKNAPRKDIIARALENNSAVIVSEDIQEAIEFCNEYAPEHLQIVTKEPFAILPRIKHAGSIFLGQYAPVPVGDYASGTNHVLPTGQCAKMFSGLSVDDFIKKPTFQYLTKEGLACLKDAVTTLAEAEGLPMHAQAVRERFDE